MRKISLRTFQVYLSVVALLLSLSRLAFADASARLVYVRGAGAEQCPGEPTLRAAASARLGYDAFFPWAHDTLFVEITSARGVFRIGIKLIGDDSLLKGARDIVVKENDCAAIVDAVALTMSLMIDPTSFTGPAPAPTPSESPAPPDEPVPQPSPAASPEPPRRPSDVAPASSKPALHIHAGAGAEGSLGSAPGVALGVTAFAGIIWRPLSIDVEGRYDPPESGNSQHLPGVRVQSSLAAAALVPCLHLGSFFACAVGSVGSLTATSTVKLPSTAHALRWAGGPRVGLEVSLQRNLTFRAYGELLFQSQPRLQIDGSEAYTYVPLSGGIGTAVAWRFF